MMGDLQRFVCFTFLPLLNDGEGACNISQLTNNGMEEKSCIKTHFCVIWWGGLEFLQRQRQRQRGFPSLFRFPRDALPYSNAHAHSCILGIASPRQAQCLWPSIFSGPHQIQCFIFWGVVYEESPAYSHILKRFDQINPFLH